MIRVSRINHHLRTIARRPACRALSTATPEREKMFYDVVTVGAGPAGLAAAIKLKQLSQKNGVDISVCVVEKGSEVGAHILSGNVFEPRALDELFPDWRNMDAPIETQAGDDEFFVLTEEKSYGVPNILLPPQLHNHGNYVISLSQLVRWLAQKAEELGVEIYPGFAASEVLYNESGAVQGIATRDSGISKSGEAKDSYTPGVELHARHTIFAEGARGSCSEEVIEKFKLRDGKNVQTYGIGVKEVWQIPEEKLKSGYIQHTVGWPLQSSPFSKVFGGSFLYHMKPNIVMLGMVVGLDYENPYLNPYKEFQRWKHHPQISKHLEGGECISYGARVLNEGGWHSIPKLTMPGGLLVGCSAGFLNSVKIKGSHLAIKSGMLAAEALYPSLVKNGASETVAEAGEIPSTFKSFEAVEYTKRVETSWVADELKEIRNTHAAFHAGLVPGMIYTGISTFITKGKEPWTLKNTVSDSERTLKASQCKEIVYPKPDGKLSFDLLSNLQKSGTSHDHDQPSHLRVKANLAKVPSSISIKEYAGPEQRFCPAGVYEYSEPTPANPERQLIINAQNCLHCKTCSIKTPKEFITWTVPEGGGGPAYTNM